MISINSPPVPYQSQIPACCIGTVLRISGQVHHSPNKFTISLLYKKDVHHYEPDAALHISVRFHERVIVRNTRIRGDWQKEERHIPLFPFEVGRPFEVMILVEADHFKIAANKRHLTEFRHRMSFLNIDSLAIAGDVTVSKIEIHREPQPLPFPPTPARPCQPPSYQICPPAVSQPASYQVCPPAVSQPPSYQICPPAVSQPIIYTPPLPFVYFIPGGLRPGFSVIVSGRPNLNADRFTINFQKGDSSDPSNIALHFNPRFEYEFRSIVRNTKTNGSYGREETSGGLPLERGVNFDIQFRVESDKFMIAINGTHFTEYRHRMTPLSSINVLRISGPLVVNQIRFI